MVLSSYLSAIRKRFFDTVVNNLTLILIRETI